MVRLTCPRCWYHTQSQDAADTDGPDGFINEDELGIYSLNNVTAKPNDDGSSVFLDIKPVK